MKFIKVLICLLTILSSVVHSQNRLEIDNEPAVDFDSFRIAMCELYPENAPCNSQMNQDEHFSPNWKSIVSMRIASFSRDRTSGYYAIQQNKPKKYRVIFYSNGRWRFDHYGRPKRFENDTMMAITIDSTVAQNITSVTNQLVADAYPCPDSIIRAICSGQSYFFTSSRTQRPIRGWIHGHRKSSLTGKLITLYIKLIEYPNYGERKRERFLKQIKKLKKSSLKESSNR